MIVFLLIVIILILIFGGAFLLEGAGILVALIPLAILAFYLEINLFLLVLLIPVGLGVLYVALLIAASVQEGIQDRRMRKKYGGSDITQWTQEQRDEYFKTLE
jgi:hypothetical protein